VRQPLTDADFAATIRAFADAFTHSAFRLELQANYVEAGEDDPIPAFVAGTPQAPSNELRDWFEQIAVATRAGKHVQRVRVQAEPPTPYQQWERWLGQWNTAAGEDIRYLSRRQAARIGLLPAAGTTDYWLLDDRLLILMHFDEAGHRTGNEITDDPEPVEQARQWRNLAVRHGVPIDYEDAAHRQTPGAA
jgi:hypothetical protein